MCVKKAIYCLDLWCIRKPVKTPFGQLRLWRPQVRLLPGAPNAYNPNQIFQIGNGFGFFIDLRYNFFLNGKERKTTSKPRIRHWCNRPYQDPLYAEVVYWSMMGSNQNSRPLFPSVHCRFKMQKKVQVIKSSSHLLLYFILIDASFLWFISFSSTHIAAFLSHILPLIRTQINLDWKLQDYIHQDLLCCCIRFHHVGILLPLLFSSPNSIFLLYTKHPL